MFENHAMKNFHRIDLVQKFFLTNCITRCVGIFGIVTNIFFFCKIFFRFQIKLILFKIMPLSCRFYRQKYPEVEDVVMVKVLSIGEMGAYVHLLEYNNIEGMFFELCFF